MRFALSLRRDQRSPLPAVSRRSIRGFQGGENMSNTLIDAKLKEALKSAIEEILEERKDFVREVLQEALEDIALGRAIEEGEQSKIVNPDEVFNALEA
jgi:hypothetical protein